MNKVTTLGIDLAKIVFQLHGVDEAERMVLRRQVRRKELLRTIETLTGTPDDFWPNDEKIEGRDSTGEL